MSKGSLSELKAILRRVLADPDIRRRSETEDGEKMERVAWLRA